MTTAGFGTLRRVDGGREGGRHLVEFAWRASHGEAFPSAECCRLVPATEPHLMRLLLELRLTLAFDVIALFSAQASNSWAHTQQMVPTGLNRKLWQMVRMHYERRNKRRRP